MRSKIFIRLSVLIGMVISISTCSLEYLGSDHLETLWKKAFVENCVSFSVTLTANTWADGNITSSNEASWFKFTATANVQYIHVSFGTLSAANGLYVQVYDSTGSNIYSRTMYYNTSINVTSGQVYYIRVSSSSSGTYQIALLNVSTLTANTWADGNITSSNGEQWFKFTASARTQYIHISFGTLTYLDVQVYNSDGNTVVSQTTLYDSYYNYVSSTVTIGQEYYIKITYASGYISDHSNSGTYQIAFNDLPIPPGVTATTLTADTWADGSLSSNGEQWFKFTATSIYQYIHVSFGTLTSSLYIQMYNSTGGWWNGSEKQLYYSSTYDSTSLDVHSGDVYYIRVRHYSSYSGTYWIAFNESWTPPS